VPSAIRYLEREREKGREDDGKEVRSYWMPLKEKKYLNFKEKALHLTRWRNRFGRGYGPVTRQTQ
jgi:hypothetical protein